MLSVTLTGGEALQARLDGLPAAVLAAVAAKSVALADQVLTLVRTKAGGGAPQFAGALAGSVVVDGPRIEGDRVVVRLSAGDLKSAAVQALVGIASPRDVLPSRAKALALATGGGAVRARALGPPEPEMSARAYLGAAGAELAREIEAALKSAALDASRAQLGA